MNVQTLDVSKQMAEDKYQEYLEAVKKNNSPEYKALKTAFYHTKKGKKVIDISQAIKVAGVNNLLQPNLAIIRANEKECFFDFKQDGSGIFRADRWKNCQEIKLPANTFPAESYKKYEYKNLKAIVPTIPPGIKPKGSLKQYHILWEAHWEEVPRDPILLKHIYRYIYVVLAHWDLTDIEMAVLKK